MNRRPLPSRLAGPLAACSLLAAAALPMPAVAAKPAAPQVDAAGGKDHPLIQRFAGSWLVGWRSADWDQTRFPTSNAVGRDDKWAQPVTVEGKVTRLIYLAPRDKTPLEVHRNYQQALAAAGFKPKYSCEQDCNDPYFAMSKTIDERAGMAWAKGDLYGQGDSRFSLQGALSPYDGRFTYGTLVNAGKEVHVMVYTGVASNKTTNTASTFIQIVEPKGMPTGQVQVNAAELQRGLQAEGRVSLYGVYFDTGRAELKPESQAQIAEMAKLLQADPKLKVYIVGHTDNQGALDANLVLSQQRAQAVVQALAGSHKVDVKRLLAKGVASLAPLATNATEDGRARNRRVELVLQ